jgi:hypothetical protein
MCGVALWTLIIMECVKIKQETRYIDTTYFWILLTVNLLTHFLLWMSGTPYIYPEERPAEEEKAEVVRRDIYGNSWYKFWDRHPAVHYATGGFGKFFMLLIALDCYYYGYIMRDTWYEVLRVLVMDATLVVGVFILNSHNRVTTQRGLLFFMGFTLVVYNLVMILRSFYLLTASVDHTHDTKPLIPLDNTDSPRGVNNHPLHPSRNHFTWDMYRGYEHTRVYDMVIYTSLLLFFSILLKLREKVLYPDHDVLGWNNKIDLRDRTAVVDPERRRLIARETVVVNANPLEA